MKIYAAAISLICVAAILLFSYSRKDKGEHIDDICEDIKGIEVENIEDIKACLNICNGKNSVVCVDEHPSICFNDSNFCLLEIRSLENYSCKDGTDSCAISKRKQKFLEIMREIASKSRKRSLENKLQCEVFGCDAPKDSSFFMITEDYIISRYNRKYLLMSSYTISDFFSDTKEEFLIFKIPLPNNDSASLSDILPDCSVRNFSYDSEPNTLFLKDSKCYLDSLITTISPDADFFCFSKGLQYHTLMKEKGNIGKILKLKSENLGINHFDYIEEFESEKSLQPEERDHYLCLYYLDRIRVRYSYDILYMYPFYKSEICNLNRWRGVRLKEQPKKNMQLKSLFTVPKNCLSI